MVFSSHLFVYYFLPLALALYYALPQRLRHSLRLRNAALTASSYAFYGWANPAFTLLMATSTVVDYVCGLWMVGPRRAARSEPLPRDGERTSRQRLAVTISIVTNLSLLGLFKYFNFFVDSTNGVLGALGLGDLGLDSALRVVLPLGISFYTFQSMSYSIDVYRGHCAALRNPVDFACYVSLFPQLVAGPIIRFSEIAEQLAHRTHTVEKLARGAAFLSLGFAKKILLANPCGKVADTAFGAAALDTVDAWFGIVAYSMQIYFDFSGYSDMAIGLGLMLGFVFPKNFDSPYRANSITDFWRRWHISLSSWLRDYLYIPLGGNRRGAVRTYVNLALVMLLGGLWHGAAWTFVIWGGLHGVLLAVERARGGRGLFSTLPQPLQVAGTFLLVTIAWVPFRADDIVTAGSYLAAMAGLGSSSAQSALVGGVIHTPYYLLVLAIAATVAWAAPQTWDWTRTLSPARAAACTTLFWAALAVLHTQSYNPFIYFIF
ncbi:MAG: MBOAT family protein [Acidobacteriota bacterium]|nr:MBOAT family protein [Acidobacteriota bacterium]